MFIDKAVVTVTAGTGGSGSSSFARFKYKPKAGPDGGDGGRGGSIYVEADANLATLLDYRYRAHWKAERGEHGKGKNMTGASRDDITLPVPPGTIIREIGSGTMLGEVIRPGDRLLVAKGGRGGRGNTRFATSTHRAPREWEPGEEGEERELELELRMIADVGLVGEPNAGKSTLLSVLSAARPKIADYPFTTLEPNLGVVGLGPSRSFVMADIPGIIEGAHQGKGLGLQFLRHVERTRLLLFLVPLDAPDPQAVFNQLRAEIAAYSATLARKPFALLLSKRDLLPEADAPPPILAPEAIAVLVASSAAGSGLEELKQFLWEQVDATRKDELAAAITDDVHALFHEAGPAGTVEMRDDGGDWDAPLPGDRQSRSTAERTAPTAAGSPAATAAAADLEHDASTDDDADTGDGPTFVYIDDEGNDPFADDDDDDDDDDAEDDHAGADADTDEEPDDPAVPPRAER